MDSNIISKHSKKVILAMSLCNLQKWTADWDCKDTAVVDVDRGYPEVNLQYWFICEGGEGGVSLSVIQIFQLHLNRNKVKRTTSGEAKIRALSD